MWEMMREGEKEKHKFKEENVFWENESKLLRIMLLY